MEPFTSTIQGIVIEVVQNEPKTWGQIAEEVAERSGLSRGIVEKHMCSLVETGRLKRLESAKGFAKFSDAIPDDTAPGAQEGKYQSIGEKRLEIERKDGTYEKHPWGQTKIPTDKAV